MPARVWPATFLGALALGALANAWPMIAGQPTAEAPGLRGLTVCVFGMAAALAAVVRWGRTGPLPIRDHVSRLLVTLTVLTLVALPSAIWGVTFAEARELSALLQGAIGWTRPLSLALFCGTLVVTAYLAARLVASAAERSLAGGKLVVAALATCLLAITSSAARLAAIPAPRGLELLEKQSALLLLLSLAAGAVRSPRPGPSSVDLRSALLLAGLSVTGWQAFLFATWYLNPPPSAIERVRTISRDARGTQLAATLEDRPDLYGLFTLDNASAPLRLDFVRPAEPYHDGLLERFHRTWLGTSYLDQRPDAPWARFPYEKEPPPKSVSVVTRSAHWPHFVAPTGIRIDTPIYDWAITPSGRLVVATRLDRPADERWRSIPGLSTSAYSASAWRPGRSPAPLLDALSTPPLVARLDNHSVEFERSTRGLEARLGRRDEPIETITCALPAGPCEPSRTLRQFIAAYALDARDGKLLFGRAGSWTVVDVRTREARVRVTPWPDYSFDSSSALLLPGGALVVCSLRGRMPNWDTRLTAYDPEGKTIVETLLGNIRLARLAGVLDDGTMAFVWRKSWGNAGWEKPLPGWTLEAWDPRTGERRRLAGDLSTLPGGTHNASPIFLDDTGRLVTPSTSGVRVLVDRP